MIPTDQIKEIEEGLEYLQDDTLTSIFESLETQDNSKLDERFLTSYLKMEKSQGAFKVDSKLFNHYIKYLNSISKEDTIKLTVYQDSLKLSNTSIGYFNEILIPAFVQVNENQIGKYFLIELSKLVEVVNCFGNSELTFRFDTNNLLFEILEAHGASLQISLLSYDTETYDHTKRLEDITQDTQVDIEGLKSTLEHLKIFCKDSKLNVAYSSIDCIDSFGYIAGSEFSASITQVLSKIVPSLKIKKEQIPLVLKFLARNKIVNFFRSNKYYILKAPDSLIGFEIFEDKFPFTKHFIQESDLISTSIVIHKDKLLKSLEKLNIATHDRNFILNVDFSTQEYLLKIQDMIGRISTDYISKDSILWIHKDENNKQEKITFYCRIKELLGMLRNIEGELVEIKQRGESPLYLISKGQSTHSLDFISTYTERNVHKIIEALNK